MWQFKTKGFFFSRLPRIGFVHDGVVNKPCHKPEGVEGSRLLKKINKELKNSNANVNADVHIKQSN